jgi:AcrR family transcriptional regulator
MNEVAMETPSKQQLRTRETQARLLGAAEEVFVRDGYEGAQLDEIAATAGRSKGAVYTHFRSKEDLFLALFEHRTRAHIERLADGLRKCADRGQSLDAFREFYIGLVHDETWPILTLEFKLYALRHPESKERLRNAFEMSKAGNAGNDDSLYQQMFGQLAGSDKEENDLALSALGPIVSGLMLERHFEPDVLSEKGLGRILGRIFDALFQAQH